MAVSLMKRALPTWNSRSVSSLRSMPFISVRNTTALQVFVSCSFSQLLSDFQLTFAELFEVRVRNAQDG